MPQDFMYDKSVLVRVMDMFRIFQVWLIILYIYHIGDVIMGAMASHIASVSVVYSTVCSGGDQRKHQRSASRLCEGNSPVTGEFPAERASNAENASIWWRHHASGKQTITWTNVDLVQNIRWSYQEIMCESINNSLPKPSLIPIKLPENSVQRHIRSRCITQWYRRFAKTTSWR